MILAVGGPTALADVPRLAFQLPAVVILAVGGPTALDPAEAPFVFGATTVVVILAVGGPTALAHSLLDGTARGIRL